MRGENHAMGTHVKYPIAAEKCPGENLVAVFHGREESVRQDSEMLPRRNRETGTGGCRKMKVPICR